MKVCIYILLFITLNVIGSNTPQIITAASNIWPPYIDTDNPMGGFSIEIIREAFKSENYTLELIIVPWARAEIGVKNGTYDILPDVWFTSDRKKDFYFSDPYTENIVRVISLKKDNFVYKNLSSLKDKNIAVIKGYSYSQEFVDAKHFERIETPFFINNIKMLLAGRVDLTVGDELVSKFLILNEDPNILDELHFSNKPLSRENLFIASGYTNPRHKEIIQAFNRGLKKIIMDGTYESIQKKYIKFNVVSGN